MPKCKALKTLNWIQIGIKSKYLNIMASFGYFYCTSLSKNTKITVHNSFSWSLPEIYCQTFPSFHCLMEYYIMKYAEIFFYICSIKKR